MVSFDEPKTGERYHPRVPAGFMVKLLMDGKAVLAKARDVSMNGVRVAGAGWLERDWVTIAIPLPNDREVVTGCKVRRREQDELALEFDELDWDDMFALARFLHPRLP